MEHIAAITVLILLPLVIVGVISKNRNYFDSIERLEYFRATRAGGSRDGVADRRAMYKADRHEQESGEVICAME